MAKMIVSPPAFLVVWSPLPDPEFRQSQLVKLANLSTVSSARKDIVGSMNLRHMREATIISTRRYEDPWLIRRLSLLYPVVR